MDIPIHPHRPFAVNRPLAFLLLCLVAFLLLFVKKSFIESETAVFEFLQDRPEGGFLQLVAALQFLSIPLIYFWKLTVVAFILWIGCFLYGYRVTYGQCWMVALVAEFLFWDEFQARFNDLWRTLPKEEQKDGRQAPPRFSKRST